ncbi:MAG: hypothetical protein MPK36_10545, partial [Gammaproteobacteria bacterium]|nr:hypothetical protein [Gammaproteobacteria bacterium]
MQSSALADFDVLTAPVEADGSRTFQLDVIYGDNAASVPSLGFELHMDGAKLEFLGVENAIGFLQGAALAPAASSLVQTSYADYRSNVGPVPDDGDEATDSLIYPGWSAIIGGVLDSATLDSPARVVTLNFKWKPGAAGNTNLNFTANPASLTAINSYTLTSLNIQGPPLAGISVSPENMMETDSPATVSVSCGLSRPALEATTCTLGVGAGSTAANPGDYAVAPAIAGETITIAKDAASATKDFTVTPNLAGGGGTIDFELTAAVADGDPVARDGQPATFTIIAPGLVIGELNGPVGENLSNRGGTLVLRARPQSDSVVVDLSATVGADEIVLNPAKLTFTTANWDTPQGFFVRGENDDYDDGDQPFTVAFAINDSETMDTNYHGISETLTGVNIDDDVALLTASAAPKVVSEQGSAQMVDITVGLTNGILVEADTTVTLALGTGTFAGTATVPADFAAIT